MPARYPSRAYGGRDTRVSIPTRGRNDDAPLSLRAYDWWTEVATVLMIPPAVFKNGYDDGVPSERWATKDLMNAGFLVFQI